MRVVAMASFVILLNMFWLLSGRWTG
jgi:hypothetical protein